MDCEPIIRFDWDKPALLPYHDPVPGQPLPLPVGYDRRPPGALITDIVWHSTEHGPGQPFAAVCKYLRDSRAVSVHYAIGPDGEIQRILDPLWRAWGCGPSLYQGRAEWNDFSISVELYHREGGDPYPAGLLASARWLARELQRDHPTITGHVAHRWVAVGGKDARTGRPLGPTETGRKIDPTDMSDAAFRALVSSLKEAP